MVQGRRSPVLFDSEQTSLAVTLIRRQVAIQACKKLTFEQEFCHGETLKSTVRELIENGGLDPVDVGPLKNARLLEPLAMLWIDLAVNQRQGINHAFKLLRR
jgi:hypothetical protein